MGFAPDECRRHAVPGTGLNCFGPLNRSSPSWKWQESSIVLHFGFPTSETRVSDFVRRGPTFATGLIKEFTPL